MKWNIKITGEVEQMILKRLLQSTVINQFDVHLTKIRIHMGIHHMKLKSATADISDKLAECLQQYVLIKGPKATLGNLIEVFKTLELTEFVSILEGLYTFQKPTEAVQNDSQKPEIDQSNNVFPENGLASTPNSVPVKLMSQHRHPGDSLSTDVSVPPAELKKSAFTIQPLNENNKPSKLARSPFRSIKQCSKRKKIIFFAAGATVLCCAITIVTYFVYHGVGKPPEPKSGYPLPCSESETGTRLLYLDCNEAGILASLGPENPTKSLQDLTVCSKEVVFSPIKMVQPGCSLPWNVSNRYNTFPQLQYATFLNFRVAPKLLLRVLEIVVRSNISSISFQNTPLPPDKAKEAIRLIHYSHNTLLGLHFLDSEWGTYIFENSNHTFPYLKNLSLTTDHIIKPTLYNITTDMGSTYPSLVSFNFTSGILPSYGFAKFLKCSKLQYVPFYLFVTRHLSVVNINDILPKRKQYKFVELHIFLNEKSVNDTCTILGKDEYQEKYGTDIRVYGDCVAEI